MILDIFIIDSQSRLYYYAIVFMLLIMLLLKNRKLMMDEYTKISKDTWAALLVMTLIGYIIRLSFSPMQPISGVSVWSHRKTTVQIAEEQIIGQSLHTRGYSLLVSPIYSLTKDIVWSSHMFDIAIGSLSIIMIFMLTYILFKDPKAALISALILTVLPWHIFFSGTHGVEVTASFFIMLSMILIFLSIKSKDPGIYFLSCISILFTALIKKEETILLLVLFTYFLYKKRPLNAPKRTLLIAYLFAGVLLIMPYIMDLASENFYEGQFGTVYPTKNIIDLLEIFKYNGYIALLMLAPLALYFIDKKRITRKKDQLLFLVIWLSIILIPFMLHKDINTRYFLFFLMPFIILGSFSLSNLLKTKYRSKVFLGLAIIMLVSIFHIRSECPDIGDQCMYLTPQPFRWTDSRLSGIYSLFSDVNMSHNHLIFLDPQSKNAFSLLYNSYPSRNVHTAWQLHNDGALPLIAEYEQIRKDRIMNQNYNIYLIEFEDETDYCDSKYYYLFCETIINYKKELYYTGDRYKIYHIT